MPFPFQSLVQPPGGGDQDVLSAISQLFAGEQDRVQGDFSSLLGTLEGSLADVQNAPGPQLQQVPGGVNPLAQIAAAFSSSLGQQLGAPGAVQNVQRQIAGAEQAARQAEQQNLVLEENDRRQRMQQILALRKEISDTKIKALQEGNDILELDKELKANFIINTAQQRSAQEAKLAEIKERGRQDRLTQAERPEKATAASAAAGIKEDANILRFQENIESITKELEGVGPLGIGSGLFGIEKKLSDEKRRQVLDRAIPVATAAGGPKLRRVAMDTAINLIKAKNPDGVVSAIDPEWLRVRTMLKAIADEQVPPLSLPLLIRKVGITEEQ